MRRATVLAGAAFAALVAGAACGDVPTLPGGIAYVTPILLPSPSITFGDTLRDSLGHAAPLRVYAIDRNGDTIRTIDVRFLLTTVNSGAAVGGDGILVAPDTLGTLRLVAQVIGAGGETLQLQTAEVSIPVVPRADSIAPTTVVSDTVTSNASFSTPLSVTVTGPGPGGVRGPVGGIRVHYRVAAVYPAEASANGTLYFFTDDADHALRPDSTIAFDTTSSAGVASRTLIGVAPPGGAANPDSVVVLATATSQAGDTLRGSPARFTIRIRR